MGEVGFELMESTTPDGDVARYIEKNGEGVMLLSFNPLLGGFLDLVVREQTRIFKTTLAIRLWDEDLDDCRGRDPDMPIWNESTRNRLRQVK